MEKKVYESGCKLLKRQSLELRNKVIANLVINGKHRQYLTDVYNREYMNLHHLICGGFDWTETPEGFNYWYHFANNLKSQDNERQSGSSEAKENVL
jgi:hypothetical protein